MDAWKNCFTFEGGAWGFYPGADNVVISRQHTEAGKSFYSMGTIYPELIIVSVNIEKLPKAIDPHKAREAQFGKPLLDNKIEFLEIDGVPAVKTTIGAENITQKGMYAFFAHEDCLVVLHLSKVAFDESTEPDFAAIVKKAAITTGAIPATQTVRIAISDNAEALSFDLPTTWLAKLETEASDNEAQTRIDLSAQNALLMLTTKEQSEDEPPTVAQILGAVVESLLTSSTQKELPVQTIEESPLKPQYVSAEDRTYEPSPTQYQYIVQGVAARKQLLTGLTLLYNGEAQEMPIVTDFLSVLGTMNYIQLDHK